MNAREAKIFLTEAALLDPRMKRVNALEQADMASMWAEVLADVEMDDARAAMRAHYCAQIIPIMPAHVLEQLGVTDAAPSTYRHITDDVLADSKRRVLAAHGVTEAEYSAHEHDADWILAHFSLNAIAVASGLEPTDENGDSE